MATKLNWEYQDRGDNAGESIAQVNANYRVRAVHDSDAQNPFEDGECNWPITVYTSGDLTTYDKIPLGPEPLEWLPRFTDALLVHWQVHIAKILGSTVKGLLGESGWTTEDLDVEIPAYTTDADTLRHAFSYAWDNNITDRERLDVCVELYKLLDIPAYCGTTHGYSQGDWAEVLVVATPEAQKQFGTSFEHYRSEAKALSEIKQVALDKLDAWITDKATELMLKPTVDLYGDWAWGNVFGYIVESLEEGADPEDSDSWGEVEDGSCWGYYGTDFDKSGLEESALECVPELETTDA